ncbi:Copper-exporting P-type ATPase B [Candidatus Gugararchaeum adminiculabundum]|nr:Copper-exporting P-type ATPase B [Candidatus Gugararchaeum adminiculabundum]
MRELAGTDFKTAKIKDVLAALDCSAEGLSESEAKKRFARDGPNAIPEKCNPLWRKVLAHFTAPMALVIFTAGSLALLINHLEDAAVIFFLYFLNGFIGIRMERKADGALAKLSEKINVTARVKRDGKWERLPAVDLVAGDLVELDGGDVVPGDCKIIGGEVELDQSTLTGESLPVVCGIGDMAYASSLVQRGHAQGIVVLTSSRTTFGRTAQLAQLQRPPGQLDKSLYKIGEYLVLLVLICIAVVIAVGILRGYTLAETMLLGLTLLVASVPSAMPAVIATIIALGALRLANSGVVVRQLSSLEELSGVTVICSDKTGTLTQNKLSVGPVWANHCAENVLLDSAASCMPLDSADTIDLAIARRAGKKAGSGMDGWKSFRYTPADGDRKRATMLLHNARTGAFQIIIKGAPQKIIPLCKLSPAESKAALARVENFATDGFRTIAVAAKPMSAEQADGPHAQLKELDEQGSELLGLITLADQPREDAAATITQAGAMGVQVRMVSGDHAAAARYIAGRIGLKGSEITSSALEKLTRAARAAKIRTTMIFSEVLPAQKYEIVKTLQEQGEIVAVTGDGVNDAPALKRAPVGIAVTGATEVARSAADLVLTRPGLAVIVNGIQEGRAVYERMHHYMTYRLAETFRILFLVPFAIITVGFFPLTPIQLVVLSVLNDLPILAMATDRVEDAPKPEKWRVRRLIGISSVLGFTGLFNSGILLYLFVFVFRIPVMVIQTLFFLKLSIAGHLMLFHARNEGPIFKGTPPSHALLAAIITTQLIATGIALFGIFVTPVGIDYILLIWGWSFLFFFVTEWAKLHAHRMADERGW